MAVTEMISLEAAAAIREILGQGCGFPIYMTCVAANGAMLGAKYEMEEHELKHRFVFDEHPKSGFQTPINMMLTDSTGKAFHVLIEGPQKIDRKWIN